MQSFVMTTNIVKVSHGDGFSAYSAALPLGTVLDWIGDSAPSGFVFADGQRLKRCDYPESAELFKPAQPKWWQLKRRHRAWAMWERDGEFQVPDMRHRTFIGVDFGKHPEHN